MVGQGGGCKHVLATRQSVRDATRVSHLCDHAPVRSALVLLSLAVGCSRPPQPAPAVAPSASAPVAILVPPAIPSSSPPLASAAAFREPLFGTIGNGIGIRMTIAREGSTLRGSYLYERLGKPLSLRGEIGAGGRVQLEETDAQGKVTGRFVGDLSADGNRIDGSWSNAKGEGAQPFSLRVASALGPADASVRVEPMVFAYTNGFRHEPVSARFPHVVGMHHADNETRINALLDPGAAIDDGEHQGGTIEERLKRNTWVSGADYVVNCDQGGVLDVTVTVEGMAAYPDSVTAHHPIDLGTGRPLDAASVFTAATAPLVRLVDGRMQAAIRAAAKRTDCAGDSVGAGLEGKHFVAKDLNDFSISPRGVTFHVDFK